jgi:hypothetical protein
LHVREGRPVPRDRALDGLSPPYRASRRDAVARTCISRTVAPTAANAFELPGAAPSADTAFKDVSNANIQQRPIRPPGRILLLLIIIILNIIIIHIFIRIIRFVISIVMWRETGFAVRRHCAADVVQLGRRWAQSSHATVSARGVHGREGVSLGRVDKEGI